MIGCSSTKPEKDYDYEAHLEKGKELIEKKRYIRAQEELAQLAIRSMHTEYGDDALFYLGESYFLNKEYILAVSEYERLIRKINFSEFNERARWRICESYLALSPPYYKDQEYSLKALERIQEFIDDYPYSQFAEEAKKQVLTLRNKQGKKMFESGILYTKLGAYDSAILSYETVLNSYYDSEFLDESRLNIIKNYILLNDVEKAQEKLAAYSPLFKNNELRSQAEELVDDAVKKEERKK